MLRAVLSVLQFVRCFQPLCWVLSVLRQVVFSVRGRVLLVLRTVVISTLRQFLPVLRQFLLVLLQFLLVLCQVLLVLLSGFEGPRWANYAVWPPHN